MRKIKLWFFIAQLFKKLTGSSRAVMFTRVEGGTKIPCDFKILERDITGLTHVEKRQVYSKHLRTKITSRVIKIKDVYVHSLFFDNGNIYDADAKVNGFQLRPHLKPLI